jgi:hypothetical protein
MATADGDLVPFQDVRVSRSTAPALLCGIGEKSVWLLRWHISGKLWCTGDRGTLFIRLAAFRFRGDELAMQTRLLEALRRIWTSFWERSSPTGVDPRPAEKDHDSAAARGRFWAEFREGRREAEAHRSRPQ